MYPAADLLKDCQRLVKELERDLRDRAEHDAALLADYRAKREAGEIGVTQGAWLSEQVTQAAVAWVLATVFVRFLEDNRLIDEAWISGPDDPDPARSRLRQAVLTREGYFHEHPDHSDAQYLQHVVRTLGATPACRELFAADRSPLFRLAVSGDGARRIVDFWRERDDAGAVRRLLDVDDLGDTRWLGDLYQDLSAEARKRYALLQTPDFVEEFILDHTLTPAIATFGLGSGRGGPDDLRCIDPTCGSGHFLLGMFRRLWHAWEAQLGPGVDAKEAVARAMRSIHGIDLNPFAVAISRFRLMLAGLAACGLRRLKDCPRFEFALAVGDTLLLGTSRNDAGAGFQEDLLAEQEGGHPDYLTPAEYEQAKRVLSQRYHVVVGNPPYIAVKDAQVRERIKRRYASCHMKWTLSVPFTERFFALAQDAGDATGARARPAGYVGLINSNNFTKREFGKKLVEEVLPRLDLTHVLDTSGCYIPGHGTPTVILFGRNQAPAAQRPIRAVLGIRGEPGRPEDAARGQVWTALVEHVGQPGAETPWLSVVDVEWAVFARHPWSLGGGGAGALKEFVEAHGVQTSERFAAIGFFGFSAADEILAQRPVDYRRRGYEAQVVKQLVAGDDVRDWVISDQDWSFFPYADGDSLTPVAAIPRAARALWPFRTSLWNRPTFAGGTYKSEALPWWRWHQVALSRLHPPLTITFGEVATHNHFALCRGGVVFKQTAPVIKLLAGASEDDHLALLSCLNSSTAAFWFRQVCFPKGGDRTSDGARVSEEQWNRHLAHNSTTIEKTPITSTLLPARLALTRRLDALGQELAALQPPRLFATQPPTTALLATTAARVAAIRAEMIVLQEELDWLVYRAYGILDEAECPLAGNGIVPLALGERAFEIDLARKVAAEEEETSWFERHRSTPITEPPAHWPAAYRAVVQRRLDLIAQHPHIALLEKPEHKRRWASDPWDEVVRRGLRDWLCDRLEDRRLWPEEPQLTSTTALAERAFADAAFAEAARLYLAEPGGAGGEVVDQHALILELVTAESVPALPALRYSDEGLAKRVDWEQVWELQRREDGGEANLNIPVPPRYTAKDFQKTTYWSHRGKLDVPKERFVSYPGCQAEGDPGLLVLWAGFDHAQHARALVAHYQWAKDDAGWPQERLIPLLVGLDQLVPWLKQWHNEIDPASGSRLGDSYAEFLAGECQALGLSVKELRAWRPAAVAGRGRARRARG